MNCLVSCLRRFRTNRCARRRTRLGSPGGRRGNHDAGTVFDPGRGRQKFSRAGGADKGTKSYMSAQESASNRPGSPYPIRPIEENELDAFLEVDEHAFSGTPMTEADRRMILDRFEFDRSLAAFDGPTQIGVTGCFSFQLSVPGAELLPAAGVSWVSVLPTHRRRGVLNSLMRRQLADVQERGEPLAILWASESVIYPRYGYGRASWSLSFTVRRGEGTLTRAAAARGPGQRRPAAAGRPAGRPARAGQGLRHAAAGPARALRPQRCVVAAARLRPAGVPRRLGPAALPAGRGRQRAARLRALLGQGHVGRLPARERAVRARADGGR